MIQEQFINYVLDSKDKNIINQNRLDDKYFSDYKKEWNFILNHINKYDVIPDKVSFLDNFPDFPIIKVEEPPQYLLNELMNNYKQDVVGKNFNNKIIPAYQVGDVEKLTDTINDIAQELNNSTVINSVDIIKDTSRYNTYIDRIENNKKYFVKTGFDELDAIIGGWDREEELATIAARTNKGKSWVLLLTALAAAKEGLTVGIYSGEMSDKKVGYRIDTLLGNIKNGDLIHGNVSSKDDYERYIKNVLPTIKGSIKVLTPNNIGGPAGVSALRAFIEKDNLDMLIVDQHSLLEDDRHAKNPVEKAANVSRDLKNLQVMKKIPIIAASQQNRTSTENGVGSEHIAQSDRIAQDSTTILFLERDKSDENTLLVEIVKSRDNEVGKTLKYKVNFNTGTFDYIPEEDVNNSYHNKYDKDIEEDFSYGNAGFSY